MVLAAFRRTTGDSRPAPSSCPQRWAAWGHNVVVYARKDRYEKRPSHSERSERSLHVELQSLRTRTPSATFLATLDLIFRGRQFRWIHLYNTGNAFLLPLLRVLGFRVVDLGRRDRVASKEVGMGAEVGSQAGRVLSRPDSPTGSWWTTTRSPTSMPSTSNVRRRRSHTVHNRSCARTTRTRSCRASG